ncbi:MAG: hypothetical protein VKN15_04250 [Cyanobacteriota bacterium]|nr:hypothetical protein [Cyanobacteriota bacterium]
MARRHWLDPLARHLLMASGQLPAPAAAPSPDPQPSSPAFARAGRRLSEALRSALASGPQRGAALPPDGSCSDPPQTSAADDDPADALERDLLALKLSQNPALPLRDARDVRHAAELGWRLDVNRATAADWSRLPGCTAAQADLLERLRAGGVQLSGPEDLRQVLALDAATLAAWQPLLAFRWYDDPLPAAASPPPVAVNQATAAELAGLPGLTPERCRRLLQERRRGPFRDLPELGERLVLPAEVLERWIGRVSFAPGPAGPQLPPAVGGAPGGRPPRR